VQRAEAWRPSRLRASAACRDLHNQRFVVAVRGLEVFSSTVSASRRVSSALSRSRIAPTGSLLGSLRSRRVDSHFASMDILKLSIVILQVAWTPVDATCLLVPPGAGEQA
jgi:hypothetical protein